MFYAFLMLLELGFGIALGNNLVVWDHDSLPTSCSQPSINPWWFIPLFLGNQKNKTISNFQGLSRLSMYCCLLIPNSGQL